MHVAYKYERGLRMRSTYSFEIDSGLLAIKRCSQTREPGTFGHQEVQPDQGTLIFFTIKVPKVVPKHFPYIDGKSFYMCETYVTLQINFCSRIELDLTHFLRFSNKDTNFGHNVDMFCTKNLYFSVTINFVVRITGDNPNPALNPKS